MNSVFDDPEEIKDDPETQAIVSTFTEALKQARIAKGLSQMKVNRNARISQKTVSEIESGGNFKMNNYVKLCRAIGVVPVVKFLKYRPKKQAVNQHTLSSEAKDNS
jgi:transcriptional regulator with XRE-family HTH domain